MISINIHYIAIYGNLKRTLLLFSIPSKAIDINYILYIFTVMYRNYCASKNTRVVLEDVFLFHPTQKYNCSVKRDSQLNGSSSK